METPPGLAQIGKFHLEMLIREQAGDAVGPFDDHHIVAGKQISQADIPHFGRRIGEPIAIGVLQHSPRRAPDSG